MYHWNKMLLAFEFECLFSKIIFITNYKLLFNACALESWTVCCLCARGCQWWDIFLNHWYTNSIKPRLLFPYACYCPIFLIHYYLLQLAQGPSRLVYLYMCFYGVDLLKTLWIHVWLVQGYRPGSSLAKHFYLNKRAGHLSLCFSLILFIWIRLTGAFTFFNRSSNKNVLRKYVYIIIAYMYSKHTVVRA